MLRRVRVPVLAPEQAEVPQSARARAAWAGPREVALALQLEWARVQALRMELGLARVLRREPVQVLAQVQVSQPAQA